MKTKQKTQHMNSKYFSALSISLVLFTLLVSGRGTGQAEERFEFQSYKQVLQFFEKMDYTEQSWDQGSREVPRVYLTTIPPLWSPKLSRQIETKMKKEIFFRVLAPLILKGNENIAVERKRLLKAAKQPEGDQQWLRELAVKYRVNKDVDLAVTQQELEQLNIRVNIIPPSLVMAQTAEESGWATSRFAVQGNAMFGQWTWGGKGITPKQQRKGKGDYKIAAFESPLLSIVAYMLNLNTNHAYDALRNKRAALSKSGKNATGPELAETLTKYSERGPAYVKSLKGLISYNKLTEIDQAHLKDMEPILLIPTGGERE